MRNKTISMVLILACIFVAMSGTWSITPIAAEPQAEQLPQGELSFDWLKDRSNFVCDNDSVELVIGINGAHPSGYAELENLVIGYGGKIVDTSVFDLGEHKDVLADIPFKTVSSFIAETRYATLASYIEPNFKVEATFVPNDPNWTVQWGPKKIEADWAWNTTTSSHSILVAVIDTGIDYNHSDLKANYNASGYDWINYDNDPKDDNGHGTHCAGIIAAVLNNGKGIAGLAQVQIMAEKVINAEGEGSDWSVSEGIIHAVDQGADILSLSLGGYIKSDRLYNATKYAYESGVLIVAAAGNEAWRAKLYPAAYDEVIAVTATNVSDSPAWWTNFGDWVEVAAPGVHIYSTMPTYHVWLNYPPYNKSQNYDYMSGTSMATPHVAGVAALIWSRFPNMTHEQVRAQLRLTAVDLGASGFDEYYGYGRINASGAVQQAPTDHDLLILHHKTPPYLLPGNQTLINTTVLNFGKSNESNIKVQLLINGTIVDSKSISFLASGKSTKVNFSWTPMVKGVYNVTSYVARQGSQVERLWVDNNGTGTWTQWSKSGSDYLKAEGGGYIYVPGGSAPGKQEGWFTFQNHTASGTINSVVLKLRAKVDPPDYYAMPIHVYLHDGTSEKDLGIFTPSTTSYNYFNFNVTSVLNTWDKIDKAKIRVKNDATVYVNHYIDAAKLEVTYIPREINMKYDALSAYVRVGISRTIRVQMDYATIQEAVDASFPGDIIQVDAKPNATPYYENVRIDKPYIRIIGKDPNTTIIDGNKTTVVEIAEENVEIANFTIQNAGENYSGIFLYAVASKVRIVGNKVINNSIGIDVEGPDYNTITGNTVSYACMLGILIWDGSYNTISDNTVTSNGAGIQLITLDQGYNNIVSGNTVASNDAFGIYVVNCYNTIISGNTVTLNGHIYPYLDPDFKSGIVIGADSNIVRNNKVTNNFMGISLYGDYNTVYGNEIVNNTDVGIFVLSSYNKIGLYLPEKDDIIGNEIKNNHIGIQLNYSDYNNITANKIKNNYYGIRLIAYRNPQEGEYDFPTDNKIYWNNFMDNMVQVYRNYGWILNRWTHRWGVEGSYWSDYKGQDLNGDGVGDTILPHYEVDWYPLMKPYIPGDINHDGAVDIYDLTKLALAWNSTAGPPPSENWNPHADLNEDGRVYEEDLDILSNHWHEGSSAESMDFETAWKLVKSLYGIP